MTAYDVDAMMGSALLLFVLLSVVSFIFILALFGLGYWLSVRRGSNCPYVKRPLEPATLLSYEAVEKIHEFMNHLNSEENPAFDLRYAAVCRETGRIFPDALNKRGRIYVTWGFLNQRRPGKWASWGSLNEAKQRKLRSMHATLKGYQTEHSSPLPRPKSVSLSYALAKPGPLYVDMKTGTLLGWKQVPDSNFELLVVQCPKRPLKRKRKQ